MTWIRKYWIRSYVRSCIWIGPAIALIVALILRNAVGLLDHWTGWTVLGFDPSGARDIAGIIAGAMLTMVIFLLSMLLLALQIASSQLSPRIIAGAFRNPVIRRCLAYFTFAFAFAAGTQARISAQVPQISVLCAIILCVGGLIMVFKVVDHMGKSLRPVSVVSTAASHGMEVIANVYPNKLDSSKALNESHHECVEGDPPARNVHYAGKGGVFLAFDAAGLARRAAANCLIRNVPAVGDFVAHGDLLFRVYGPSDGISDKQLHEHVAMGEERTVEQDPGFTFRVIVDIAARALSPAVNDPTTAVMAIDQIHRLLLRLGARDLGDGKIRDASQKLRLVFPTPNWDDFVFLGVAEIRHYGAGSIQVLRRLRAMLEHLIETLPAVRHEALRVQLKLLDEAANRSFPDPWDRQAAAVSDYQGLGGSRAAIRS